MARILGKTGLSSPQFVEEDVAFVSIENVVQFVTCEVHRENLGFLIIYNSVVNAGQFPRKAFEGDPVSRFEPVEPTFTALEVIKLENNKLLHTFS